MDTPIPTRMRDAEPILPGLESPEDLHILSLPQLDTLARELGDALGTGSEHRSLTDVLIAMHWVFSSELDAITFDTGLTCSTNELLLERYAEGRDAGEPERFTHVLSLLGDGSLVIVINDDGQTDRSRLGPVNGHNIAELIDAFDEAASRGRPCLVRVTDGPPPNALLEWLREAA